MAHFSKGEQFLSSPISYRVPPHLRKKAIVAPSQSLPPSPAAAIAQGSSDMSPTVRMTPSTGGTYNVPPSSLQTALRFGEMPSVRATATGAGFPASPIAYGQSDGELQRQDQSAGRFPPPPNDQSNDFFDESEMLNASIHSPQEAEKHDHESLPSTALHSADCAGSHGTSDTDTSTSFSVRRYQAEDLIDIAKQCSGRLPPPSAVQAMFLYEMQRETESERLFAGQMFRLAKQGDEMFAQARRHADMEARIAKLEKQMATSDVRAHIATSEVRMNVQQQTLAEQAAQLQKAEDAFSSVSECLQALKKTHDKFAANTAAAFRDVIHQARSAAKIVVASHKSELDTSDIRIMKEELDVLFKDRDGILSKLAEVHERMKTLADNIGQLTIQKTLAQAISPVRVQRLPAVSLHGDLVDVTVPKSKPAVSLSGSQHADAKSFVPGKPWGA